MMGGILLPFIANFVLFALRRKDDSFENNMTFSYVKEHNNELSVKIIFSERKTLK